MFLARDPLAARRSQHARHDRRRRLISIVFVGLTAVVLVVDLEAAGAFLLHPDAAELALLDGARRVFLAGARRDRAAWLVSSAGSAGPAVTDRCWRRWRSSSPSLATAYTGFLFAQGLGRDLWQGPHATIDLHRAGGRRRQRRDPAGIVATVCGGRLSDAGVLGWTLARSLARALRDSGLREPADAERDAPSRAGGPRDSQRARTRSCSGAARSAGRRSLPLVAARDRSGCRLARWSRVSPPSLVALAGGVAWEYIWVEAGQSVPLS